MKKAELIKKLSIAQKNTWIPIVENGDGDLTASKFSGKAYLKNGEKWPICKCCNKPMQLFVQLKIEDLPTAFKKEYILDKGILQAFYCTSTEPLCAADCEAYMPFSKAVLARIIEDDEKAVQIEIPEIDDYLSAKKIVGWKVQDDYPNSEELIDDFNIILTEKEATYLSIQLEKPISDDKLGGYPYWTQHGVNYPKCPKCSTKMKMLFQVDGFGHLGYEFNIRTGTAYIMQCPTHKNELTFFHQ